MDHQKTQSMAVSPGGLFAPFPYHGNALPSSEKDAARSDSANTLEK